MTDDWSTFGKDVEARTFVTGQCPVCHLLGSVSPEEAKHIESVLTNAQYSTRAVYDAFKARGAVIGRDRISHHRNGRCS